MLERTAASIEPCSLHRVLPTATRSSLRSRARLHNTFWYHGATALELDDACRALDRLPPSFRCSDGASTGPESPNGAGTMIASASLLDFLYPHGATALLRKFRPDPLSKRLELGYRVASLPPRFYTSFGPETGSLSATPASEESRDAGNVPARTDPALPPPPERDSANTYSEPNSSKAAELQRLLNMEPGQANDAIWQLYSDLEPSLQDDYFRLCVLNHLAPSARLVDAPRISRLFAMLKPAQWTDLFVGAAVKAKLLELDLIGACSIWKAAVGKKAIVAGADHLMAFAFRTTDFNLVLEILELFVPSTQASGCVVQFGLLARVANFKHTLKRLYLYIQKMTSYNPRHALGSSDILNDFVTYLATNSLAVFGQGDACYILTRAKDASSYEAYIRHCITAGHWKVAGALYRVYRGLPGLHIPFDIIRSMTDVYQDDARGMEEALRDWYEVRQYLTREGYQKYTTFYAERGNIKEVDRLVREYEDYVLCAAAQPPWDEFTIASRMHAYAVRGDAKGALEVLDTCRAEWGDAYCSTVLWNILLDAYVKADKYQKSVDTFSRVLQDGKADAISFGTIMLQAARRGELQFTLELFKLAADEGIQWNVAMADSLVEAYCQNDRFEEAEQLCHRLSKNHTGDGDRAEYWNTLISHFANRRDLTAVNRILAIMTAQKVVYNNATYRFLLLALVNCRQAHHALHFVKVSRREQVFQPTMEHYVLLLGAFIKTREPMMAIHVKQEMAKMGLPESAQSVTNVLSVLGERKLGNGDEQVEKAISLFLRAAYSNDTNSQAFATTNMYAKMIFILTQMRDSARIDYLLEIYCNNFPRSVGSYETPIKLLETIMLADFYDGNYRRAKKTWELVFERARASGEQVLLPGIAPGKRYDVVNPCRTMQRIYVAESDAEGLVALVTQVTAAGFSLDSKNWNYYVQSLARLKKWKEAFRTCEEMLMPNWVGWARLVPGTNIKKRLPLEIRRLCADPHRPRPISYTLLLLSREYLDLERKKLWSNDLAKVVHTLEEECPLTVKAITTMVWDIADVDYLSIIAANGPAGADQDFILDTDTPALAPGASVEPSSSIRDILISPSSSFSSAAGQGWEDVPKEEASARRRHVRVKRTAVSPGDEVTEDGLPVSAKSRTPTPQEAGDPAELIRCGADGDWEDIPERKPRAEKHPARVRRIAVPAGDDEFTEDGFLVSAQNRVPGPNEVDDPGELIRQALLGGKSDEKGR
ncbi:hypothetical protein B0T25DRAFT_518268 [Lasiosphaeria hispida]|uniref:Translation regulator n=1 Tax=Lasiosphaeria hispida TaxID=260671 RepID=A0AAJ0MEF9_9PEZI|nr:hypothetical protein B0T25DRAFT_518268 [Lasiosphaeria hispida]